MTRHGKKTGLEDQCLKHTEMEQASQEGWDVKASLDLKPVQIMTSDKDYEN